MKKLALLLLVPQAAFAIIGGAKVEPTDPFAHSVVGIQIVENATNRYKGTGVLISDRVVLTAGHNFFYISDPTASEVIYNVAPNWGPDAGGQRRGKIARVEVFPGWHQINGGTENDLALVFLAESAPSDYKPLELDTSRTPTPGEIGLVLGYGFSYEGSPLSDFRLRKTELTFQESEPQKLWFTSPTSSISGGDSGGPVIFVTNGVPRVYGVAIHLDKQQRSAFSRLEFFRHWIDAMVH